MSNFFSTFDGEEIEQTEGFEAGGLQAVIPEGTTLLCAIASATWEPEKMFQEKKSGDAVLQILWHVLERGKYKDFLVKDKIKLFDANQTTVDKAKKKLLAYDSLATGLLLKSAKAGKEIMGDSLLVANALNATEAMVTFAEYDMPRDDGTSSKGNWVRSVKAKSAQDKAQDADVERKAKNQPNAPVGDTAGFTQAPADDFYDPDLPF